MSATTTMGPTVTANSITFRWPDPERTLAAVRLCQELWRPRLGPQLAYRAAAGAWEVTVPRPDVLRLEYAFEIEDGRSGTRWCTDPDNRLRAPGPFGDKSVLELPGYEPPRWPVEPPLGEDLQRLEVASRALGTKASLLLWSSDELEPGHSAPLLVVHDGPEYAEFCALASFLGYMAATGGLPSMRAALLEPPGDRDQVYSASAAYARCMAHEVLPALAEIAPTAGRSQRAGMGASLGALAMLHVHRRYPASFGALFLQSGSFFRRRFDSQESDFVRFDRISRFVGTILSLRDWAAHPVPLRMTCGSMEENLANNRAVTGALAASGYDASLHVNKDAHNWTAWRDTLDPHLAAFLARVWT